MTRSKPIALSAVALVAIALASLSPQSSVLSPAPHAWAADSPLTPREWARPLGRLDTKFIRESSGIDKSGRYEGIYWTHNDSGNPAELYAVKLDGTLVARVATVDAPNIDWEDIAVADGFLYLADIGNNFGWFSSRTIYKFAEPDPHASDIKPIKPLAVYRYGYPGSPFDAEALIVRGDRLFIIRKSGAGESTVFRLTPGDGEKMTVTPVQELTSTSITGADLTPDGRYLVVTSVWLLSFYPVNDDLTFRKDEKPLYVRYPFGGGVEACCFDGEDVIITAEDGWIYRVPRQVIETQKPFDRRRAN